MKSTRKLILLSLGSLTLVGLIAFGITHRSVSSTFESPSKMHIVTISYRTYLSFLPMAPGASSDKPCFVKITGRDGTNYGEIPVPMVHMVDLEWSKGGASIRAVGEWDFENHTCFYWANDGREKIWVSSDKPLQKAIMITPTFDTEGYDRTTFHPFLLQDARDSKWKDLRLQFSDWEWFEAEHGSHEIDDYYMNGYGVEGLVKAVRLQAGLEVDSVSVEYNSEGDCCFIHFTDFDEAVTTANLASVMIKDSKKLQEAILVARDNDFEDG